MKPTQKHLKKFKGYCEYYLKLFGLDEWDFEYGLETKVDFYGEVTNRNIKSRKGFISLGDAWFKEHPLNDENLKRNAKHEIIHILLADLAKIGQQRYVATDEMYSVEERLVQKLIRLLPE